MTDYRGPVVFDNRGREQNRFRGLELITGPKSEPLTLDEAKLHLRIDTTDDDAGTRLRLRAARSACEQYTSRALVQQRWKLTLDDFPDASEPLRLFRPPLIAVTDVRYLDIYNVWQTIDPVTALRVVKDGDASWLVPHDAWPQTLDEVGVVEVTFDAGYINTGTDPAPPDGDPGARIPFEIKAAILLTLGTLDIFRENTVSGTIVTELPRGAEALLSPFRASLIGGD